MNPRHGRLNGGGDGLPLSVGDDDAVFSGREMRVAVRDAWVEGWDAALDAVDGRRVLRGGRGGGMGSKNGGGEGGDLRRLVGERFANALEGVWVASLRYLRSTVPGDGDGMRVRVGRDGIRPRTGLTDRSLVMRGAAGSGGRGGGRSGRGNGGDGTAAGLVMDEAALAFKAGVDRKLRKITREMELWLERRSSSRREHGPESAVSAVRKCVRCRRYGEEKWMFCPYDGAEMKGVG